MSPIPIVVVLNGVLVASAPPAQLVFGHVMAPLAPVVSRIADRAVLAGDDVVIVRGAHACALHIGLPAMTCDGATQALPVVPFGREGRAFVPLAEVVRALGGSAAYDAGSHTIDVHVRPETDLNSPAPFDPNAPSAAPTQVFTPSPPPATPTPRPVVTGSPTPRRTAIPVTPSRVPGD